jgi:hypothetical protein
MEPISENYLTEENDLVLIENDDNEKDSENPLILKTEEVTVEQNSFLVNDKHEKDSILTKRERVNEDPRFSGGTVKWEFGFS